MTTIVSFLPVFFLTGRDYRLFSPLAYTKTFAIAAAMVTAVTIVPALSRLMLRSSRYSMRTSLVTGLSFAALLGSAAHFLWGPRLADHFATQPWVITTVVAVLAFIAGWQLLRERIRPIEEIPSSRFVRWIYAARLRHALNHKVFALSFPAMLLVLGLGAWIGLPTVLRPLEKVANVFGADLNEFPGYVDAKTHVHGPAKRRLDRAGRRQLVLHADALSGGQFLASDAGAANARCLDWPNSRSQRRARQDWSR